MKKQIWKSKTVWFQLMAMATVLNIPEIRHLYCSNPKESVSLLAVLTIALRAFGSNIGKEEKPILRIIKK